MLKERLNFRTEYETSVLTSIIKGFDSDTITSAEEFTFLIVPYRKSPHSVELVDYIFAVFTIAVEDGFSVSFRAIFIALRSKIFADTFVIIYFAVENYGITTVG